MQVTETLSSGLKREYKVVLPAAELDKQLTSKLQELSKRANIKGFRVGKVPVPHLRRVYGKAAMAEVVQKAVDEQVKAVPAERNLKPAYQPEVRLPEDETQVNAVMDGKSDLEFSMAFEVIPNFDLQDHSVLEFVRHVVEVNEDHLKDTLNRIAGQSKTFSAAAEGAAAAKGDKVTINFVGKVDGVAFEGGTADDVEVELGSNQMIPGFEDQIVGAKAGEHRSLNVTFPAEYGVAELAGKPAEFSVTVTKIENPNETSIDDDFAKRLGFEDLSKLKDMIKTRIGQEFGQMTAMKLKRDVLDALDKLYSFELPEKLVDAEFRGIWNALQNEMARAGRSFADEGTTEEDARKEYRAIAERRVRLGLVLGTLGEREGVQVTEQEMQEALLNRARQFPGQERQVFEHYRKTPNALMELRGPIFEQKVVDLIVGKAKVSDKPVSREELQAMVQEEEQLPQSHDHDHDHDHDHGHDHDHHGHDHKHA